MTVEFAAEQTIFDPSLSAGVRVGVVQVDKSVTDRISGGDYRLLATAVGTREFVRLPDLDEKSLLATVTALADPRHTEYGVPFGEEQFSNISKALTVQDPGRLMADVPKAVQQLANSIVYEEYLPVLGSPWKGAAALASVLGGVTGFLALGPLGAITFIAVIAGGIIIIRAANGVGEGLENLIKRLFDQLGRP